MVRSILLPANKSLQLLEETTTGKIQLRVWEVGDSTNDKTR